MEPALPASQRLTLNLAAGVPQYIGNAATTSNDPQSHWWFQNTNNSATYSTASFVEANDTHATWTQVGLPYDANIPRTFINQTSGGGQGSLTGQENWYRLHFKVDPKYAGQKFMLNVEGAHTAVQVFINGTLLPGISAVAANAQATHVVGFIPVILDLTPYLHTDGATDNVIAIDVSRGDSWFEQPSFCGAFRFGQAMAGLFRNVYLYVTNPVHIPLNVYSNQRTWGTYVGTVSEVPAAEGTATAASAVVEVHTNVLNESKTPQQITLTTQIVDAQGNVVVTAPPITQSVAAMTSATFPSTAAPMFDQKITVPNPTLWYPNNSPYGKPYLYRVYHIVSVNGVVVDSAQSPLGIRLITWDSNFPYFNGHQTYLWGGSSRYDYPALGSSVPDEQWWRDMSQIAAQGGNVWRVGHCTSSEEMVEAADAYGIMIDQPSGDGEGAWNAPTADNVTLKEELHRDMIIRDRSHPSILDWEEDNGGNNASLANDLAAIETSWDSINPRAQASRAYSPTYAFLDECDGAGCEVGNKNSNPNNPAFGAEYWDNMGTGRGLAWDYELAFAAPYLDDWRQGRAANAFGMAQWYFADSPGEISLYAEFQNQPAMANMVRSLGYSSVDMNRFPRLLYYAYQANWVPYSIQPVVHLAHHWNRAYQSTPGVPIQENAFSNCPGVRLLVNGVAKDPVTGAVLADQTPNPWNINSHADLTQNTITMPGQVHWVVNWAAGSVTAQCLDINGNVVPGVSDTRTTAGTENKIVLRVVPAVTKPDGSSFQWTANGSDAAFVSAEVQDANGNIVPTAADNVTFSVTGPAAYMGGSQQYVADPSWTNYYQDAFSEARSTVIGGQPYAFFHAPGDPELNFEGGLTKIALRSTFTPGTVTVTATAPGLASSSVTLTSVALPAPSQAQPPAIIVPPVNTATTVGYPATFSVAASGSGTLTYQWSNHSGVISGATSSTYTIPATTMAQNGETFTVTVSNSFGSVTSTPVTLTLAASAPVAITTQPASQSIVVGQTATLTVAATGSPTLNYAWYANGALVQSGAQASYTTPVLTATGTQSFYVIVSNPVGQLQSATAMLTINAPTPVSFTTQPVGSTVTVNQPVQFTAVVAGSAPYTYQWQFTPTGGSAIILAGGTQTSTTISYTVPVVTSVNVGSYTVTVNNAANAPVTSGAAQITLAPPGVNLVLGKTATSSSTQNACTVATTTPPYTGTGCLGPENAVDGNLATRWGSATANAPPTPPVTGIDPSWLQVDLGSVQTFNAAIINWENAAAAQYQILYTSADPATNPTWNVAYTNKAGTGGTETINFPSVQGRYIRLNGTQRTTQYGYSVFEFQVYNVAQCGGSSERYTVNASNASLVTDNSTGLTWTRTIQTDNNPGAQFTGISAQNYCSSIGMRLPTQSEALAISGASNATCAFPGAWSTWTSTVDPNNSGSTAYVAFDGTKSYQVTNNYPGETLCVSGTAATNPPVIQTQPQPATVAVGQSATFSVVATGTGTLTYQWSKNGTTIGGATSASYTTPATVATDNGALFSVAVGNAGGTVVSNAVALTVTGGTTCSAVPSAPAGLTATAASSSSITLSWTAVTPPANCTITSYSVYSSTGTIVAGGVTGTTYTATGLTASTAYSYYVKAADTAGTSAASATASATTSSNGGGTGTDVLAINAGGPAVGSYLADQDFVGGSASGFGANVSTAGVVNSAPASVYQTQRIGNFTYTIPGLTAGANYTVRLHFAECYWTAAGKRLSNISINGTQVLSNFDIFAAAGGQNQAVVEQFALPANASGQIVVQVTTVTDNAALNAIEIVQGGSAPPVPPTGLTAMATSTSQVNLTWTPSITPGATYLVFRGANQIAATAGTTYTDTGLTGGTTYSYTVEATNSLGTSSPSTQASTTTPASGVIGTDVLAINAAGPSVGIYAADADFAGGNTSNFTSTISTAGVINPAPMAVYQSQRIGSFTYTLPGLTAGTAYVVRLHFAECYWTAAGKRIFNVSINGTPTLTNFDIFAAAAGQNKAVVEQFTANANAAGQIVIQVTTVTDNGALNGIEIVSGATAPAPAAATALIARASSSSQINLSWTASTTAGVTYLIFRGGTQIGTSTTTAYSDTGLTAGTTYSYTVEAMNAGGTSTQTAQVSATTSAPTCAAAPSAPTGLTATAASSSSIILSWTAVTAPANCTIASYSVYSSTGTLIAGGVTGTTYTVTGLTAATSYSYYVKAVDAAGASAASATASATTSGTGTTGADVLAINAGGAAVGTYLADQDFTGGNQSGFTATVNTTGVVNPAPLGAYQSQRFGNFTYTLPGLTASTSYTVRLHFAECYWAAAGKRVFNVSINGAQVLTNFDIFAAAGGPNQAIVKQFAATANASGQIVIQFATVTDNAAVNAIEIVGAGGTTPPPPVVATPTFTPTAGTYTTAQSVTINDATAGAKIYYTVDGTTPTTSSAVYTAAIAVSTSETIKAMATLAGDTNSAVATSSYVISVATGPVAAPTSLTAVGATSTQTYLNWVASPTAGVSYLVFRATTPTFTPGTNNLVCLYSQSVNLAAATGSPNPYQYCSTWSMTNLADNNGGQMLAPSTTYYYQVVAMNSAGVMSSPAGPVAVTTLSATTTNGAPAAVTGLTATAASAGEIDLSWNASTATHAGAVVVEYRVYRSTSPTFTPTGGSTGNQIGTTKSNLFQDVLASANTSYYYIVVASNSSGTSPASAAVSAATPALAAGATPFWDMSNIPAAKNVLSLKFLNRTKGKYTDDQITWSANIAGSTSQSTIAAQPTFDMPANSSGRMYFYLGHVGQGSTDYYDFIEYTVGPSSINFDTTRVDALGIKLAARLTCGDGTDVAVGENQQTFAEDRATTFARYLNQVTPAFQAAAQAPFAPYRIVEPGAAGFNAGGANANYYAAYINQIWAENALTIPLAGPNGSGLGSNPDLSAAIFRHTAGSNTFNPNGTLISQGMWSNPAYFFQAEPYDHYAQFITSIGINGLQYAFPYNDAGGYSSDVSCTNPKTLVVAVGW